MYLHLHTFIRICLYTYDVSICIYSKIAIICLWKLDKIGTRLVLLLATYALALEHIQHVEYSIHSGTHYKLHLK